MKNRIYLKSASDWDTIKKENNNLKEVLVFKYSPICAQSLDVQQEVNAWFDTNVNNDELLLVYVDVIGARPLSQAIASETGIQHESPQVIWFNKNGGVKFSASHRRINSESLSENMLIK